MILAFDTYYFDDKAKTVCLAFNNWQQPEVEAVFTEVLNNIAPYTPGEFNKRELPCIISLNNKISYSSIDAIIIDGFVFLDDNKKHGLGMHLYNALNQAIPVIGVAKTNFPVLKKIKDLY